LYKLVIVDDERYTLEQLKSVFDWEGMGFSPVTCFSDAALALEYVRTHDVDVLFTDIRLGRDTGLELAISSRNAKHNIKIVLISAFRDFEYAKSAIRINVSDYLLKPVTYGAVTECFSALKRNLDKERLDIERLDIERLDIERLEIERPDFGKAAPVSNESGQNYQIEMAKKYIDSHIGEEIRLDDVAAHVYMNPNYFCTFFSKHTGLQFIAYLTERRIEKAIELMRDPQKKIYEICNAVGYRSKQHFHRLFKEYTGRTPVEYRNEVLRRKDLTDNEQQE